MIIPPPLPTKCGSQPTQQQHQQQRQRSGGSAPSTPFEHEVNGCAEFARLIPIQATWHSQIPIAIPLHSSSHDTTHPPHAANCLHCNLATTTSTASQPTVHSTPYTGSWPTNINKAANFYKATPHLGPGPPSSSPPRCITLLELAGTRRTQKQASSPSPATTTHGHSDKTFLCLATGGCRPRTHKHTPQMYTTN